MNFVRAMVVGLCVALPSLVQAAPVKYLCQMKYHGRGFGGPPQYLFILDEAKKTATVLDGAIHKYNGGNPITEAYSIKGSDGYRITYSLFVDFKNNAKNRVDYDVTLRPSKGSLRMAASFPGFDNSGLGARGKCQITE